MKKPPLSLRVDAQQGLAPRPVESLRRLVRGLHLYARHCEA